VSSWAVILAGGIGSRFWPLSTPLRPKQLLPLAGDAPLLSDTLERLRPLVPPERTLVLTNASLVGPVAALAPDLPAGNVIAEPRPAGTAAALAWAAWEIERRDGPPAIMTSVHADWAIAEPEAFRRALRTAAEVAEHEEALVTVGVVPTRPDPGFGYIQRAERVGEHAFRVARFAEKPDRPTAERMLREGYLWNSGIFVWRVGDFLAEIRAHTPEVAPALEAAAGDSERFFAAVRPVSVDVGVLERSDRVLVIPGEFGWDDVGTWAALRRVRTADASGNAVSGTVHALDATGNVVHAEGNAVILYGVSDLVVVARDGLTLVTTIDRCADLKTLIDSLPPHLRERP
jgi:mannose-1-phosphate guanylyltransferase